MFKSKTRSIIIPQSEHGRLAGVLASLWGNANFDRPALDFASFVQGVALHDWGYGVIDNLPIMEADESEWLYITEQGVAYAFADPVVDIVVNFHIRRLLQSHDTPARNKLVEQLDQQIVARLPQANYTLDDFLWADNITRFCDMVAFDFSFEKPTEGVVQFCCKQGVADLVTLTYQIKSNGDILVDPWPFSVSEHSGFILGYQREGYPDILRPEIINFRLAPLETSRQIYHLVTQSDFDALCGDNIYIPALFEQDGFIHCTAELETLLAVAGDYFSQVAEPILVLVINLDLVQSPVKFEAPAPIAGGGASHLQESILFPHIYGPLNLDAVKEVGVLKKSQGGFIWPDHFTAS